jgi:NAD(P)-dependent dehydrogenase (short-subunit alcohol dehydrogenase family)
MESELSGKVAIVTGGTGGIGRASCLALARRGVRLVIVDRSADTIEALQRAIAEDVRTPIARETLGLALDVTKESDMQTMARRALEQFGQIDMLIHCAGILRAPGTLPKPLADLSLSEWEAVIDINLTGTFLSNRAVLPAMIAQREGTIINLSSTSGRRGRAHDSAYCASKFGVVGMTEALAEEVRQYGIKVEVLLPDAVDTPLWEQNGPIKPEYALAPERVADLIAFMVALPRDTILGAPVLAPFRARRRVVKDRPKNTPQGSTPAQAT